MATERAAKRWGEVLEAGLGLTLAGLVWRVWPWTQLPRLGREDVWFALAWLVLLALPALVDLTGLIPATWRQPESARSRACRRGAFALGLLFLALLLCGRELGNYKLWLGAAYLAAVNLRLTGLTMDLALSPESGGRAGRLRIAACLAGVAALAVLLLAPWARTDLVLAPWPSPEVLARVAGAALLWGITCGGVFLALRLYGVQARNAWLTFLALGLGLGPALALTWPPLWQLALPPPLLLGLSLPRLLRPLPPGGEPEPSDPPPLYWLLRAMVLLWWGLGVVITLALAWWRPEVGLSLEQATWLRAVGLGAFLVICAGLLAAYSLPLLGRQEWSEPGPGGRLLGTLVSALALLVALAPLLLMNRPQIDPEGAELLALSRAELLHSSVHLGPDNPELVLKAPSWLNNVSRVMVVSLLANGVHVQENQTVAQVIVMDDQGIPHVFNLQAGVDTAEWALAKRAVSLSARHGPAPVAQSWRIHDPSGETFSAQSYLSGLFLGGKVNRVESVTIRYLYENQANTVPVSLEVRRVALN